MVDLNSLARPKKRRAHGSDPLADRWTGLRTDPRADLFCTFGSSFGGDKELCMLRLNSTDALKACAASTAMHKKYRLVRALCEKGVATGVFSLGLIFRFVTGVDSN